MMAAKTSKRVNGMEPLIEAFKFDSMEPITVLRFLAQLKRASDSNGV